MVVAEQNIITITYELRNEGPEGELLEVMDVHYPFKFYFGGGQLLPRFRRSPGKSCRRGKFSIHAYAR